MNQLPTPHDATYYERLAVARSVVRDGLDATITWLNTTGRDVLASDADALIVYARQCAARIAAFDALPAAERRRLADEAIREVSEYLARDGGELR